jgi:hypothetical protein
MAAFWTQAHHQGLALAILLLAVFRTICDRESTELLALPLNASKMSGYSPCGCPNFWGGVLESTGSHGGTTPTETTIWQ